VRTSNQPEWLAVYQQALRSRIVFRIVLAIWGLIVFYQMTGAINAHRPVAATTWAWWSSPLLLLLIRLTVESKWFSGTTGGVAPLFSIYKQSWAFLSDFFALGVEAGVAAYVFPYLTPNDLFNGRWVWLWRLVALAAGFIMAASFRRGEADGYDVLRYLSFSKLAHNGVAFTVLGGMLVYTGIPILFTGGWSWHWEYRGLWIALLLVWVACAALDGWRANLPDDHPLKLKGENLHPRAGRFGRALSLAGYVPTWAEFRNLNAGDSFGWGDILHPGKLYRLVQTKVFRNPAAQPAMQWDEPAAHALGTPDDLQEQSWTGDGPNKPG
jgi:hypothetical protein